MSGQDNLNQSPSFKITPEFNIGHSFTDFNEFPDRNPQYNLIVNLSWDNAYKAWNKILKNTTTGLSLGYSNFGNNELLGSAYSIMPFLKFNILKNKRLSTLLSLGTSFFTEEFNEDTNFGNQAITTDFTWSFRSFFYYELSKHNPKPITIGLGFFHHSNGHTRLPNQGINSILVSLSKPLFTKPLDNKSEQKNYQNNDSPTANYFSIRTGIGMNTLSIPDPFNDQLPVYTTELSIGKILNENFSIGVGAYYSFYQHYYNYINNNESLVQDGRAYEDLKDHPFLNASAFGFSAHGELLLNHIGIDVRLGINVFKPAYKIDTRINQGWYFFPRSFEVEDNYPLGELDAKHYLKRFISSRVGLKYYLFSTQNLPEYNFYIGAHINANLGQADFSEISIGYVHLFNRAKK